MADIHLIILGANCVKNKIADIVALSGDIENYLETATKERQAEVDALLEPYSQMLTALCDGTTFTVTPSCSLAACIAAMQDILEN